MVNIIETRDLSKTYLMGKVEVPALRGVNIAIEKGEFVAIMGSSGSGKSTLLNMIGMLDAPTSGRVIIEGTDVSEMNEDQRADFRLKKLGFIFQFFNLFMELTALENVAFPILIVKKKNFEERAMELLDQVGLSDRAGHKPAELSGGQQQRVAIARALANEPALLLADEPTANLDTKSSGQIINLLMELNKSGQTIVMVTHETELGKRADRIIWLRDGMVKNE
ncbi:MAG: ABC transporter ATP-binding protein [Candidatus Methanoperedens sp.]|nr:MAG: ABC transporter ATP-binding protein [Candidatus Methanoperedens sp.]